MADLPQTPGSPSQQSSGEGVRNVGRRRLMKAGLAGTPVLMTVVSKPVLAAGTVGQCTTPSGFTSINVSAPGDQTCAGRTPGFWKQPQWFGQWPAGYYPITANGHSATKFADVFPQGTVFGNQTLLDVLSNGGGPPNNVGRHIVAALFNTLTGLVPTTILSETTIKAIWSEYITVGFYTPTNGVQWNDAAIISYLLTTMPV